MSTAAQIAANQANSKLSTGATTDAGKQTVSINSLKTRAQQPQPRPRHPPRQRRPVRGVLGRIDASLRPVGVPEQDLVRSLASNDWRLQRRHSMERALYAHLQKEVAEASETAAETLKELNRTAGYAHKIERAIEKTRNELKSLQAERKAAYEAAQKEAILLTQLAHAKGQPPDQAKEFPSSELCGGFVYSARNRSSHRSRRPPDRGQRALRGGCIGERAVRTERFHGAFGIFVREASSLA